MRKLISVLKIVIPHKILIVLVRLDLIGLHGNVTIHSAQHQIFMSYLFGTPYSLLVRLYVNKSPA